MVTLRLRRRIALIEGADGRTLRALDKATSYLVAGRQYSPAFREHRWDGREHLLSTSRLGQHVPAGLLPDVVQTLDRIEVRWKLVDETGEAPRRKLYWNPDVALRPHQQRTVEALLAPPYVGRGIAKMPTRSGKTIAGAALIHRLGVRSLFVVPSLGLLKQTIDSLQKCFPHEEIGVVGGGKFDVQWITVATIQTLAKMRGSRASVGKSAKPQDSRYAQLVRFDFLLVDEVHHCKAQGEWHKAFADIHAKYSIGLSATAFPDNTLEQEAGAIWMQAVCGKIRIDVPMSELVETGHLLPQTIYMVNCDQPRRFRSFGWSKTMTKACITHNNYRNDVIARFCRVFQDQGRKTLVVVRFLDHIEQIAERLEAAHVDFRVVTGAEGAETRAELIDGLARGEYSTLVGTVIREGIDIPAADTVINAEGGADLKDALQRHRNITAVPGKRAPLFVDFMDRQNRHLQGHSEARLEVYRSEPAFKIKESL